MVRQDILGGLKLALSQGETLKKAMITFYNAGYKKEEIEEAATTLQQENANSSLIQQKPVKKNFNYKDSLPKIKLVLIIIGLIIFLSALIGAFLFKREIIEFFNNLLR